jgi:hypothetical protein
MPGGIITIEAISDRYLNRAIKACCPSRDGERWVLPSDIKNLIVQFAGPGQSMNNIPYQRRHDFLIELERTTRHPLPPMDPPPEPITTVAGDMSPRHQAALTLAHAGIKIFPCRIGRKEPPLRCMWVEEATTDATRINAWWAEADWNIGVPMGLNGLAAIDPDGADGLAEWTAFRAAHGIPDTTWRHATPHGGEHWLYRGELPYQGKLGQHIDTRGAKGYIVWPPSIVDGREYRYIGGNGIDPLPPAIVAAIGHRQAASVADLDWEQPLPGRRFVEMPAEEITRRLSAGVVDRSEAAFRLIVELAECGYTPNAIFELLVARIDLPVLGHYAEKGGGCEAAIRRDIAKAFSTPNPNRKSLTEIFGAAIDRVISYGVAPAEDPLVARFRGRWPDEGEALPDLEFWDDDKMLPKSPAGAIGILYGEFGSHKTNVTLAMALEAVLNRGARVVYAAGEGSHGIEKHRIPAHCRSRGIATKELRGRWRTVAAVPLFASGEEVAAFISAQADLKPDIVILDTLATAIAGEDENSSRAAAFLTANGPVGRIRDAFGAMVLLPAHQGKDATRGVRGHSGFGGNVDFILHIETDKEAGVVKLTVEKMRDGADGFSIYFRVDPGVPVPVKISKVEYDGRKGSISRHDRDGSREMHVRFTLGERGARNFESGLSDDQLAEAIVEAPPPESQVQETAEWRTRFLKEKKAIQNAAVGHNAKWAQRLHDSKVLPGGTELQRRWFLPEAQ